MFELIENCAKTGSYTGSIADEITQLRPKIMSMDERMTEMNDLIARKQQSYFPIS